MLVISLVSTTIFAFVATLASVGRPNRKDTTIERLRAEGIL